MQFLYSLNDDGSVCEIFNGERLMSALADTGLCNVVGIKARGADCMWSDGTLPLALDTCSVDEDGEHTWQPITFAGITWPGNPAPWWDGASGSPSSQAYGFWIEEWTGLDSVHMKRNVAQRAGRLGGANFGSLSSQSRVWKLNVVLVGENGAALEDLFRWLETTLASCCDPCGGSGMLIRTACPPEGDAGFGLYQAKGTALIEGLQWEAPPIESLGCVMRRVSFTLGTSDPCLYSCAVSCADQEPIPNINDCVPFGLWAGCNISCTDMLNYRICCPVPAAGRGTVSPVVTIENEGAGDSPAMRIYGMSDPLGIGCDPCSLPVCQDIVTTSIPAGSAVMVDSSTRRVLFRGPETGQEWVDGTGFIDPPVGTVPTFLQLSCDPGWVAVEPRALCGDASSLKISVDIVQRVGCC
jgi:hypothetical protein